jgi:hypothetical protein
MLESFLEIVYLPPTRNDRVLLAAALRGGSRGSLRLRHLAKTRRVVVESVGMERSCMCFG